MSNYSNRLEFAQGRLLENTLNLRAAFRKLCLKQSTRQPLQDDEDDALMEAADHLHDAKLAVFRAMKVLDEGV